MGTMRTRGVRVVAIAVLCSCAWACGDDDDGPSDGGADGSAAESGGGGRGGRGGGAGGRGGRSGGGSGVGGRGPSSGTGGGTPMMPACSEPAPTAPVVCGGQTCMAPTEFPMNPCVVPCCVNQGGKEMCGAKSTNPQFPAACTLPAQPNPACQDVEAMGMTFKGCCNPAMGICGIISTQRPGCITSSMAIMLPDPPAMCTPSDIDDAGTGEGDGDAG